jgi:hypothetical protein
VFFFLAGPAVIVDEEDSDGDETDLDLVRRDAAKKAALARAAAKPMDVDQPEPVPSQPQPVPSNPKRSSLATALLALPKLTLPKLSRTLLNLIEPTIQEELKHTSKWATVEEFLDAAVEWASTQVKEEDQADQFAYDLAFENVVRDEVQRWSKEGAEDRAEASKDTNNFKSKDSRKKTEADRKDRFTGVSSAADLKAQRDETQLTRQKARRKKRANKNRLAVACAGPGGEEPDTMLITM